uniref:Cnidarian restricted protein n=1 Tax=Clytia hemisphaerica TaxID=252671 RepID=A0A7M5XE73_9CNID|eukprot:TCONS_00020397-protein
MLKLRNPNISLLVLFAISSISNAYIGERKSATATLPALSTQASTEGKHEYHTISLVPTSPTDKTVKNPVQQPEKTSTKAALHHHTNPLRTILPTKKTTITRNNKKHPKPTPKKIKPPKPKIDSIAESLLTTKTPTTKRYHAHHTHPHAHHPAKRNTSGDNHCSKYHTCTTCLQATNCYWCGHTEKCGEYHWQDVFPEDCHFNEWHYKHCYIQEVLFMIVVIVMALLLFVSFLLFCYYCWKARRYPSVHLSPIELSNSNSFRGNCKLYNQLR